jgi:MFS family permease
MTNTTNSIDTSRSVDAGQTNDRDHAAGAKRSQQRHHSFGFWMAALAFLANMAFSAAPTPLYVLYQRRDHFSTLTITVVYAVYAAGVLASLFLGGHVSDWVGRKRVFIPALLINVISAVIFTAAPSLPGLIIARIVCGISVGLTTATATAYLAELDLGARPLSSPQRAHVVATAANLGGIGFGPLVAGILAQWAPAPLRLPFLIFAVALLVLTLLVALSPETRQASSDHVTWRPQRISAPRDARRVLFAATSAGLASFAVFGVFTSLAPSFLAGTMHERSHAVAGAVAFVAFAAAATAQIAASRIETTTMLRLSVPVLLFGLTVLTAGLWRPSLVLFVLGGIVTGAGGGLLFRGALVAVGSTAPPQARAEVLATYFLGGYVGLSAPVIGLGVADSFIPARAAMLVFVLIATLAITISVRLVVSSIANGVADAGTVELGTVEGRGSAGSRGP